MKFNPSMCKFGAFDIVLLDDVVRIWPDLSTMVEVQCFPILTTPTNMRAFLRFTSYDKNFIKS